jgi:hypothetical protein
MVLRGGCWSCGGRERKAVAVGSEGQELLFRAVLALKHASKQALKTAKKSQKKPQNRKKYAILWLRLAQMDSPLLPGPGLRGFGRVDVF